MMHFRRAPALLMGTLAALSIACPDVAGTDAGGMDGGGSDSGIALPGSAGAVCGSSAECASDLCIGFLCREPCSGTCSGDDVCAPLTGPGGAVDVCQWHAPGAELELGPVVTSAGSSAELTFQVPAGIRSFVVTAVDDDGLRVGITSLVAPDGHVLLDASDGLPDLNRAEAFVGVGSVMVPATDDPTAAVQTGLYSVRVGTYEAMFSDPPVPVDGTVERVFVTLVRTPEEGGVIDLSFSFAPGSLLSVADAASDPFMVDLLAQLDADLRTHAGLGIGEVNYVSDIPDIYDLIDAKMTFWDICSAYGDPGSRGTAVNVVIVDDISFAQGRSGGIPTPPGIYGTPASCIIIETQGTAGALTGVVLMHEIGHALGLFHTSESYDYTVTDPISDTPECPPATASFVDCPDYPNLMFPQTQLSFFLMLSPGQVGVMRNAPALYEIPRPAACPAASAVFDITSHRFATSDTTDLAGVFAGSCGGDNAPERAHLYRLSTAGLSALEIRVTGAGFAPLIHVRADACDNDLAELACVFADVDTEAVVTVADPAPGPYFIFVDGRDGVGGRFTLDVNEIP